MFHEQHYTFLNYPNLKNYEKYTFFCTPVAKAEIKKFMSKIEKATEAVTGDIQFPKNSEFTNIITFGDWSKTDDGSYTKDYLKSKRPSTDAIVFLGDQGYDLYEKEGKVGNEFLRFAKSITSSVPYQVIFFFNLKILNVKHFNKLFI